MNEELKTREESVAIIELPSGTRGQKNEPLRAVPLGTHQLGLVLLHHAGYLVLASVLFTILAAVCFHQIAPDDFNRFMQPSLQCAILFMTCTWGLCATLVHAVRSHGGHFMQATATSPYPRPSFLPPLASLAVREIRLIKLNHWLGLYTMMILAVGAIVKVPNDHVHWLPVLTLLFCTVVGVIYILAMLVMFFVALATMRKDRPALLTPILGIAVASALITAGYLIRELFPTVSTVGYFEYTPFI